MLRVIHSVSVMNRAGQETFIMNIYRNINREKVQFDFQCTKFENGDYDREIEALGGKILYLGENPIKLPFLKYLGDVYLQYHFFKNHKDYNVFHIHTYHAFDAWLSIVGAKLAGMKNIVLHSHNSQGLHPKLHRIFRRLLPYMKIERFACSEMAAKWMFGEKEVRRGKVNVIKNGIVPEEFSFDEKERKLKREELGLEEKKIVGHIGRFSRQKNHEFLIDIFEAVHKKNPDAVLLLIGIGELQERIRDKVKEKNLEEVVKFMGVRTDIKELLWSMDVFLFPSLYEGLSVVAIEGQAAGVPILAADTLSPETKITECINFLSLNEKLDKWSERVLELSEYGHCYTIEDIKRAGYDITVTAHILEEKYIEISKTQRRNR